MAVSGVHSGWRLDKSNSRLDMYYQGTRVGHIAAAGLTILGTAQTTNLVNDSILFKWGTDSDWASVNRATILGANTALTGIIVGTPVTPAVAANSLIVGGVTADGDIMLVTQTGGNSHAAMWVDASAATSYFYSGAGVEVLKLASAALTLTGTATITVDARITAGNVRAGAISAFATTEPTSAVVLKVGTAPVGAVATSSGIYASSTVLRKIIADGTDSAVG